jgi:hypothetical protein
MGADTTMPPFASQAQARFLYSQNPKIAAEFAKKTPSIKALPQHVQKLPADKKRILSPKRKK